MAIYFVDISIGNDTNTGFNGLTELTPLTWNNFLSYLLSNNSPDQYKLRGQREELSDVEIVALNQGASIVGWNLNIYGPWRIHANSLSIHCTASDGIINVIDVGDILNPPLTVGGFPNASIIFRNTHFQATSGWILLESDKSQTFQGCNLISNGNLKLSYGSLYDVTKSFINSILQGNLVISDTNLYFDDILYVRDTAFNIAETVFNLAVSDPNLTVNIIKDFCQFSLPDITWPEWDELEVTWRFETLGVYITASGSGSYTGYERDLFGYPRTGIGTFSFNFSVNPQYDDFVFAYKSPNILNSQLIVVNNIVSQMKLQENADINEGNIQTNERILIRSQGAIEEGDYNLNSEEGQRAIGITPSIVDTSIYDPDLPRLLEEDFYRHKRSQSIETGDDSADGGAIEVEFLDDSKTYEDESDDNIAMLTPQGRNLLARSTLGQAACKIIGFAIGRGGYEFHNPVKVLPIDVFSDNARGWIIFKNNSWISTDVIKFQGRLPYQTSFKPAILGTETDSPTTHVYYFDIGIDLESTLDNVVEKINDSTEILDTIYTERENDILHIISVPTGTIGNTIWYSATGGPFETPHANPLLGGSLIGGVDEIINEVLIDSIYEGTVDAEQCILEYANNSALAVTVKIHPNLGIKSAIGEFVLKAEITDSVFPGEVGTEFAFAIGHHPINCIHSKSLWIKRFVIQI